MQSMTVSEIKEILGVEKTPGDEEIHVTESPLILAESSLAIYLSLSRERTSMGMNLLRKL